MPNQPLLPIVSFASLRLKVFAPILALNTVFSGVGGDYTYAGPPKPPQYEVTVIPGPDCGLFGYGPANGWGINDLGNICGYERNCASDWEPFFWLPETGRIVLEIPVGFEEGRAFDLNSKDQVVGELRTINSVRHAALWQNGEVIELGTGPGGNFSVAEAINSAGQIAGTWGNSANGDPGLAAFLWEDGVLMNLELPMGPNAEARDINEQSQITGWMGLVPYIESHAFIWDSGNITDLGVIPGGFSAEGMAINNHGDVAVQGRMFNDNKEVIFRSFLWRDGQWIDIGVLPGFDETRAVDLNDAGEVTGRCEMLDSTASRPFIWQEGVMWDISELWSSDDSDLVSIGLPRSINQVGQIPAKGAHNEFSTPAIRLSPIVPRSGDLDGDGDVDTADLLILLGSWGICDNCADCPADLDENCSVSTTDLLILLSNWG